MNEEVKKDTARLKALAEKVEGIPPLSDDFGKIIRKYRLKNKVRVVELARLVQVTSATVTNWENGTSRPDAEMIHRLCRLLEMPVEELFCLQARNAPDEREKGLLGSFRRLSENGKALAGACVNAMAEEEQQRHEQELREHYRFFELLSTPAAAGTGCMFGDLSPDYTFARVNARNYTSDAIVRVSGHSMEPEYHNGELVYIKYTNDFFVGDDVVCSTADGAVIKRVGAKKLYSVNPDYPFGDKYEDDHVRVVGKVMGIVEPGDIAGEQDKTVLGEIYVYQVNQFLKKTGSRN